MPRPIVSRRSNGSGGVAVDSQTESGIMASRGGGSSLPTALRSRMESGFGADFSNVRIHNDATSAFLSNAIQAKAFTYGNDIYFNCGQYSPSSSDGQRLLAHELTHTLQQTGRVGRADEGAQENQEIEQFKEFTFEKVLNYNANDPYLNELVNFAKAIAEKKDYIVHHVGNINMSSPNGVISSSHNRDIGVSSQWLHIIKGKHLLLFHKKFVKESETTGNFDISDSIISSFLKYADFVINGSGVEDYSYVDLDMYDKAILNLVNERIPDKEKKGITIVIIMDEDDDHNKAYKGVNYNTIWENNDYFFILQGLNSLSEYESKMELLVKLYGPLQNLIISGHGNWNSITLGKGIGLKVNDSKTDTFFHTVNQLMDDGRKEIKSLRHKQAIYLDACSTNSVPDIANRKKKNFAKTLQEKVGGTIKIYANSAGSDSQDVSMLSNGMIDVKDVGDESILSDAYKGNDHETRLKIIANEYYKSVHLGYKMSHDYEEEITAENYKFKFLYNENYNIVLGRDDKEYYKDYFDLTIKQTIIEYVKIFNSFVKQWLKGKRENKRRNVNKLIPVVYEYKGKKRFTLASPNTADVKKSMARNFSLLDKAVKEYINENYLEPMDIGPWCGSDPFNIKNKEENIVDKQIYSYLRLP